MAITFSEDEARAMNELQVELSRVLLRANDRKMEAAIAAFACIRCARALLDKYPDRTRAPLIEVVIAFLQHAEVEDAEARKMLM